MTANPLSTIPPIGPTSGMSAPPMAGKFKPVDPVKLLRQHLLTLVVVGVLAFFTRSYRTLTALYATAPDPAPEETEGDEPAADAGEGASDSPTRHRDAPPIVPGIPPESR